MAKERRALTEDSPENVLASFIAQTGVVATRTIEQPSLSTLDLTTHTSSASDAANYLPSQPRSRDLAKGGDQTRHDVGTLSRVSSPTTRVQEVSIEDAPPPAYSEAYGLVDMSQSGLDTHAKVLNDGRVDISINEKSSTLSSILAPALRSQLSTRRPEQAPAPPPGYIPPSLDGLPGQCPPPPLNIVIHVVGSRGDVQPFVALGQVLKNTYGHRIRLATHPTFRTFIEDNGLEFFSIGGDPSELMAFMVKNPGLMPGKDALRSGDIGKRRKGMYEIIKGCWRSCFEAGDGTGVEVSDNQVLQRTQNDSGVTVGDSMAYKPFVADAIIANPPSFAHIHCAEKLGIPLHLMFTMPWSPTQAFPHPLANIQSSNADVSMTNFISYALVEMMTWQGLGDVINRFREKSLGLEPVSLMWAPGMASRLRIPHTYCWSPALIPKPNDWGAHISISGFYFLSLATNYTADPDLLAFLGNGPPPVYIGFGSIVVDDPNAMTQLIFEAVRLIGERALVSKGWGGLGGDSLDVPEGVFMLGNIPHDWLFNHVSCVVHHGGAGTTAAGIATGKPTVVVPFFGDQPFWGAMVAKAGAGPLPIPYKNLTAANLAAAIKQALEPVTLERAQELGARIKSEKGCDVGAKSFHDELGVDRLRCSLAPSRAAVWRVKRTEIRLSAFAAAVLGNEGLLDFSELKLYRPYEYDSEDGPWDPISGGASALLGTMGSLMMGVADFPVEIFKACSNRSTNDSLKGDGSKTALSGQRQDSDSLAGQSDLVSAQSTESLTLSHDMTAFAATSSQQNKDHRSRFAPSFNSSRSRGQSPAPSVSSSSTALGTALGAGKGVGRIIGTGLKSPMDFTLGIARGFHNAPKLYGDDSVRQAGRITGIQSGLKAAGKEFGFGFYDGISGLVTQPLEGAKKEGVTGLLKGFGKGIGGIVLKPSAAIWGLPGYTFKGIYKELQKHMGSSVQSYIIAARTAQGYDDWRVSNHEQRLDIVNRWHVAQVELGKQNKQWHIRRPHSPRGFQRIRQKSFDQRSGSASHMDSLGSSTPSRLSYDGAISNNGLPLKSSQINPDNHDDVVFESAIRDSVTATSTGDADEDALIERAIRASVAELRRASKECGEEEAIQRAIRTSVAEANRSRIERDTEMQLNSTPESRGHGRDLENSLQSSMSTRGRLMTEPSMTERSMTDDFHIHRSPDWGDSSIDTDDDDNIKLALENSRGSNEAPHTQDDEELQEAIRRSEQAQYQHEDKEVQVRSEEEIVLEYVKKQSLAEEEHRRSLAPGVGKDDEDDEMRRALTESLHLTGGAGGSPG